MKRLLLASALAIAAFAPGTPAQAQSRVVVGTLTCSGGAGVGLLIGSKKSYNCTFAPTSDRPVERYRATITKIGVDIGVTGNTVIIWTVFAPSAAYAPRVLAGNYGGAAADVAVGIGGGANVLLGGSKNSIALQPLSVQGQTGLNLAVGIAGMTLR